MLSSFEIDKRARKCLLANTPDGWILTKPEDDIGLDYWVQVTNKGKPDSSNFFIQLKGTTNLAVHQDTISYQLKAKKLFQYLELSLPVLLVVCHVSVENERFDRAYFCWVRDHFWSQINNTIKDAAKSSFGDSMLVRIPNRQILSKELCESELYPFAKTFTTRHVEQEERFLEFFNSSITLARSLSELDHYFLKQSEDPESDKALQAKQYYIAGYLLAQESRLKEAISYYEASNGIIQTPDAWLGLSSCFEALGNLPMSLNACENGIALYPEGAFLWSNMGNAYFGLGQLSEAYSCHLRAARIKPNDSKLWNNVGATLEYAASTVQDGGEKKELYLMAIDAFDKSLAIESENAYTLDQKGLVLEKLYKFQEAIFTLEKAVTLNPSLVSSWKRLVRVYLAKNEYQKAQRAVEHLISMGADGREVQALSNLVEMNMSNEHKGEWSKLMHYMNKFDFGEKNT